MVEFGRELIELGRDLGLGRPYLERERDEPLLRAVVQVTLDAAPGLVGGGDDAGAGRRSSAFASALRRAFGALARDAVGCAKASVDKCGVPIAAQTGLSDGPKERLYLLSKSPV